MSGRVISLVFELDGLKINLINIYGPTNPTERKVVFDNLHEYFLPADAVIIAGDYNKPFPSSCLPPLQNESKCEVFVMKISFHSYVK